MAGITRKMLKAYGLTDEQEDQLIEAHTSVVDALKEEMGALKTDAEKAKELQAQLEKLQSDYNDYKVNVEHEQSISAKKDAYRALLREVGISEKRIETIVKATPELDELVTLNKDGTLKDKTELTKRVKGDWADFIVTVEDRKQAPENPPKNTGGRMTKEQIMEIKDTAARQKAIAENHDLFGY